MTLKVCKVVGSAVNARTGALTVSCHDVPLGPDPDADAPSFDNTLIASQLGVTAVPYRPTDDGHVEIVLDDDVAGLDAVGLGMRDLRTAKAVGNAEEGDTILHSTGPQQAAQVQCKEKKRQVAAVTEDSSGKTVLLLLDGTNDKVQISGFGKMFQMTRDGFTLSTGGASITIEGDQISLLGKVHMGGLSAAPGFVPMLGPASGSPGGPTSPPMLAAKNVTMSIGALMLALATLLTASSAL
jgi:hypothetical protein